MIWMLIACQGQGSIDSESISPSATLNGDGSLNTTTMDMIVTSAINGEYEPCG